MKKISVIIPCYGSEKTIEAVVSETKNTILTRCEYDYEIILVNDFSPDNVFSKILFLAKDDSKIKGIDLSRNFGQHAALMAGLNHVTGDIIVCLDDDGQTPGDQIFYLIDKIEEDFDVVFASYGSKQHSKIRNIGSSINNTMARYMIDKPKDITITSFFACQRYVAQEIIRYQNPYPYVSGLLLRAAKNVTSVPISHRSRANGKSGYTTRKLISLWINGFTAFSAKPLRISVIIGLVVAMLGFIYGGYIIINKLINTSTPIGYSSTMAALLFLSGVILIMLGIIGEYIGRIYISLNNSPQFVVKRSINLEDCDESEKGKI